ncbi:hypothetical protein Y1Q_0014650 [Alligator mississippiensis]|uniref:Uncharacterized protein n=1 Tax=Alligator mississippiensis TaxID=8496 RepID=A0A151P832_ALLMI|nr:hypothetical protein Y1Q_0014650 [Alligator mississippiensis]
MVTAVGVSPDGSILQRAYEHQWAHSLELEEISDEQLAVIPRENQGKGSPNLRFPSVSSGSIPTDCKWLQV